MVSHSEHHCGFCQKTYARRMYSNHHAKKITYRDLQTTYFFDTNGAVKGFESQRRVARPATHASRRKPNAHPPYHVVVAPGVALPAAMPSSHLMHGMLRIKDAIR
ncbi:hypothetical protein N7468_009745 [Penicillium chermesinum]|uniref:Uncharacterized protein n=1 Tax=Penicillium chermesinum TaxID=63820 RepID=A0A9W9NIP1_9EURO|nr:uncharacterized protein N7468_009745 [Penicillium chermesinum]KAJ5220541.1 hypothetical protein N7468_009745 [Penicillium chermesinum]KAJ6157968.1 hypothetical protein N7470_005560 [Penicillium chermesinum]